MKASELMIGDVIAVPHEELGLVYAIVESIQKTGDIMVRADNEYMDGGYECTAEECEPVEIETLRMGVGHPLVINERIEICRTGVGLTMTTIDCTHIVVDHAALGSMNLYELHLHKLQHILRLFYVEDKTRIIE